MIALTGSSGLVGLNMKSILKERSIPFIEITRKQWDLRDWQSIHQLDHLLKGVSSIFHFGAYTKHSINRSDHKYENNSIIKETFDTNVRSCLAICEWALSRNIPVVFLSGSTVYKDPYAKKIKENSEKVISGFGGFYGFSKLLAESIFEHYSYLGLKTIVLRPSSIYGTFMDKKKLVAKLLYLSEQNKQIDIYQPIESSVNLINAADVCNAALHALENKAWGIFNIAGPENISILKIAKTCIEITNRGNINILDGDSDTPSIRFDLDCTKAHEKFNYSASINLKDGIDAMHSGKVINKY
ncbi:NAD-dependent epimerase/dehydratase family protein [Dongshaea marina]|uniref:NAD-dependent epimerase/dehydratase family protein n=1 Tax=Dongshaea marina TaxID=2047966 RepID=UPI000D3E1A60|nr:NAD(P)-dependent oxidoreductase [Dongshaea marina]